VDINGNAQYVHPREQFSKNSSKTNFSNEKAINMKSIQGVKVIGRGWLIDSIGISRSDIFFY